MIKLEMYRKKEPRKKSTIDFTKEAYDQLQEFKKCMNTDASNSTIVNELILIFLNLPEDMKQFLVEECQQQLKKQKQRYAAVNEQNKIEQIDSEIEKYNRLMAFLLPQRIMET